MTIGRGGKPRQRDGGSVATIGHNTRTIRFKISDESVARDGATIKTSGWNLASYLQNPIVLNNHDSMSPPVARTTDIGPVGTSLFATAQFATADEYPLADTIYKLLKGSFLNAASVSWLPLEWRYSTDKNRPGGIDFIRQELLEWSVVSVPALPSALVTARASGINLAPLARSYEVALDSGRLPAPRERVEACRRAALGTSPTISAPARRSLDPLPHMTVAERRYEARLIIGGASVERAREIIQTARNAERNQR